MDYGFKAVVSSRFRGHLQEQLHQTRSAPGPRSRGVGPRPARGRVEGPDPGIDHRRCEHDRNSVRGPMGTFPLDEFTRDRLLNGWDDIGLSLRYEDTVADYRAAAAGVPSLSLSSSGRQHGHLPSHDRGRRAGCSRCIRPPCPLPCRLDPHPGHRELHSRRAAEGRCSDASTSCGQTPEARGWPRRMELSSGSPSRSCATAIGCSLNSVPPQGYKARASAGNFSGWPSHTEIRPAQGRSSARVTRGPWRCTSRSGSPCTLRSPLGARCAPAPSADHRRCAGTRPIRWVRKNWPWSKASIGW